MPDKNYRIPPPIVSQESYAKAIDAVKNASPADSVAAVKAVGDALGYVTWLIVLEGLPFLLWIHFRYGRRARQYVGNAWRRGLLAGGGSLGAYGIVLWAMTQAPVSVAASTTAAGL